MSLQIIRGKKHGAVRAIIYGTEGIGKSTLAAKSPDVLIIDTEDGTGQIDAARVIALDWRAIEHAIKELIADAQGFRTVVIDSADWMEKALIDHMLKQSGKKSIEDYGYGKGYTILHEHVVRFLTQIDQLVAKGVHVVFVAHAKVTRTSPPDQTDGFDRYELKLTKQVAPLLKEWADVVLFCNYKIQIVEGTDGKLKAQGGKDRVMYATHSAAWDAKNRYGLADELPMEFSHIEHIFAPAEPRQAVSKATKTEAATNAAVTSDPGPVGKLATKQQVAKLNELRASELGAQMIEDAMEKINAIDLGEFTTEQAQQLIDAIATAARESKPATETLPPHVSEWLDENAETVDAYLVRVKWVSAGQTWRDLSDEKMHSIMDKTDKFARAAGIPALGQRKAA